MPDWYEIAKYLWKFLTKEQKEEARKRNEYVFDDFPD